MYQFPGLFFCRTSTFAFGSLSTFCWLYFHAFTCQRVLLVIPFSLSLRQKVPVTTSCNPRLAVIRSHFADTWWHTKSHWMNICYCNSASSAQTTWSQAAVTSWVFPCYRKEEIALGKSWHIHVACTEQKVETSCNIPFWGRIKGV